MHKKLFLSLMVTLVLCAGCGSVSSKNEKDTPSQEQTTQEQTTQTDDSVSKENSASTEDASDNTSVSTNQTENTSLEPFAPMEKVLDSLMLCSFENDLAYDNSNPLFFWCSLFYEVVNFSDEIPSADKISDGILIPRTTIEELAASLFADSKDLLEIPEEFPVVRYDADSDAYVFMEADRGNIYTKLLHAFSNDDDSIQLSAALYDGETNTPFCCYEFTLITNPYATDGTEPLFPYAVTDMTRLDVVTSTMEESRLIGTYQGFSDSHTVEFIIDENLNAFQIYDETLIALLSSLEENAQVTFSIKTDERTEMRTIISILSK